MSLKTLPKSLIEAASTVVAESDAKVNQTIKDIAKESLLKFGVQDPTTIPESLMKEMYSWAQKEFERRMVSESECQCEDSCGCEDKVVSEDDMPGDVPFHKDGSEDAEKKKEIDEASQKTPWALVDTSRDNKIIATGSDESVVKQSLTTAHLPPLNVKDKSKLNIIKMKKIQQVGELLKESSASISSYIGTNGAVAVGDETNSLPVHADVLVVTSPLDGTKEYRMLIQFNTGGEIFKNSGNQGTCIYPEMSLPGAKSVEDLRSLVEGLPYFGRVLDKALTAAAVAVAPAD